LSWDSRSGTWELKFGRGCTLLLCLQPGRRRTVVSDSHSRVVRGFLSVGKEKTETWWLPAGLVFSPA